MSSHHKFNKGQKVRINASGIKDHLGYKEVEDARRIYTITDDTEFHPCISFNGNNHWQILAKSLELVKKNIIIIRRS